VCDPRGSGWLAAAGRLDCCSELNRTDSRLEFEFSSRFNTVTGSCACSFAACASRRATPCQPYRHDLLVALIRFSEIITRLVSVLCASCVDARVGFVDQDSTRKTRGGRKQPSNQRDNLRQTQRYVPITCFSLGETLCHLE